MSKLPFVLPKQAFEIVRDAIGPILVEEILNQFVRTYDKDFAKVPVFKERHNPGAPADLVFLNVMLEHGHYDSFEMAQSQGHYRFIIEGITEAKTQGTDKDGRGDTRSMLKLQKILGLCRAILMNPVYDTLGFDAPFISNRRVEDMVFEKPIHQDAEAVMIGRIVMIVEVREVEPLLEAVEIAGSDTTVNLYSTNQGYVWSVDEPSEDVFDQYFDDSFHPAP